MKTKIIISIIAIASPVAATSYLLINEGSNLWLAALMPTGIFLTTILFGYFLKQTFKNQNYANHKRKHHN